MTHVLLLDSINEDIFFCGPCKQVFNSLSLYVSHKKNECKNDYFAAKMTAHATTSDVSTTPCSVDSITTKGQQNQELYCRICKRKFKKMRTLHGHLKMHEKPYQCVICGRCFLQNSHLQRHVLTHKVWPEGLSETTAKSTEVDLLSYSCLYCNLIVPTYNQFRVHLKTHLCVKKYKCVQIQCNSLYKNLDSLLHHVSATHKTAIYRCHNCYKIFNSLEQIASHYQSFNNRCIDFLPKKKIFKCTQCDAVFRKAEKLSLHMLTETHKKSCIHCNKIFSSDKRLRLHLQVHRKVKPFQCNVCGQSFHMKKYLSSHLLKHGEKKYPCKVCNSIFKRSDSLQRHEKIHQIKKMYKCPFAETLGCKKEFSRSDKLKSHINFHTKKSSVVTHKSVTGTLEICIVPLDSKSKD